MSNFVFGGATEREKKEVKIVGVKERILVKKYIDIEINRKPFTVYIVNDVVNGIYKKITNEVDGVIIHNTVNCGKALKGYTGMSFKEFLKAVEEFQLDYEM